MLLYEPNAVLGIRSRSSRPATGKQRMPNREMEKIESKYDLYQWIQVTMAIRRLKAGISEQIGMLQSTLEAGLGITHIVEKLKEQSEDMIALTVQKNFMDDEMSAELNAKREHFNRFIPEEMLPTIDESLN